MRPVDPACPPDSFEDAFILRGAGSVVPFYGLPFLALVSQTNVHAWARGFRDADQMNPTLSTRQVAALAVALAASLSPGSALHAAQFAAEVSQYNPGSGAAPGYDQPSAALGEPSRSTPGEFGGPVDPFSSPWQPGQIVSIGTGGSLTVGFQFPVLNSPGNPYGLDFLIFGSAAFLITNGDFSGGGITDGSLFGGAAGPTRVSVSDDGIRFLTLDPARAPLVDGLFPTDGAGDFTRPVPPGLTGEDFNGLGLAGIRALYDGSGGGVGYDLDWARHDDGTPASLDSIRFVRIEVLGDRAEIDALSVVPETSTGVLFIAGWATLLSGRLAKRTLTATRV